MGNMIKKLLLVVFFITFFIQATFAQEVFKITSVNFDTSNSLIFLTSPDNTTESIMKNIKLIKLQNPKRVYFDIDSAILTTQNQSWFLNSGGVKQVKVNQFSTNPGKIRVVLYLDENFDQSKISFMRINNNIVIKFKDGMCKNEYYQNTYKDERALSSDFYQNLSISSQDIDNIKTAVNTLPKDAMLNQVQNSFKINAVQVSASKPELKTVAAVTKELKLKSKYYLNFVSPKDNGFLLSGFGVIGIEKPMYLTNPARVVFDIPNAIMNPNINKREFRLGQDIVKIGEFDHNKLRIVITSTQLEKYFPIFSSDGQSILFLNDDSVDFSTLFDKTTNAVGYNAKNITSESEEFVLNFNSPVVHSIRRDSTNLNINFYNALCYNEKNFASSIKGTNFDEMQISLLPKVGLKLSLPLDKKSVIGCYLSADGKSVKIVQKGVKAKQKICSAEQAVITNLSRPKGKRSIVLDPGHGGADYGAIRSGINEKDINLDVAKRVQAILERDGVSVYMTRDKDETVSLEGRTTFTAKVNPDIFVSIHVNSAAGCQPSGLETHYFHDNSLDFAQTVHERLISYVKSKDRGIFKSRFYVINHTTVPAILVEIGFISNDIERAELVSEQRKQQTAKAISEGVLKYLNTK